MENNKRKALGKGLEQLFNSEPISFDTLEHEIVENTSDKDIVNIPISEIRSNPYQPRFHFDEEALLELAQSIKTYGVVEPIIVKKSIHGYELIAGERRTRASKIANVETIPAIIKDFSDQEMMDIAILENIQREDLTPIELAEGFKKYMVKTGITQEEMARKFGKSRSYITNIVGLTKLPSEVKAKINTKQISLSHAKLLSKLDDEEFIKILAERIVNEGMSVRELEKVCNVNEIAKKKPIVRNSTRPIIYNSYENAIRDRLGCKVLISKNKITIPFDSTGDLTRIFDLLNVEMSDE